MPPTLTDESRPTRTLVVVVRSARPAKDSRAVDRIELEQVCRNPWPTVDPDTSRHRFIPVLVHRLSASPPRRLPNSNTLTVEATEVNTTASNAAVLTPVASNKSAAATAPAIWNMPKQKRS